VYFVALCRSNVTVSIRLYAGKPEYPSGTRPKMSFMGSDNPNGAENQQERPIGADWIVGFVDGEGCFSIGFVRQPSRKSRKGYKTGYQVAHSFVVVQGARSIGVLEAMQRFFGVGAVGINRRHDNHKEDLYRYIVSRREDLLRVIIPFFEANPLRTAKRGDFEKFTKCVEICQSGRHLTPEGLIEIAEITETMNHRKSRQDLIGILRGHTPNTLDTGRRYGPSCMATCRDGTSQGRVRSARMTLSKVS
jgi:hypothetical protein